MYVGFFDGVAWPGLETTSDTVAPIIDEDPWASDAAASQPEAAATQEGWADFCSFAPAEAGPAAEPGMKIYRTYINFFCNVLKSPYDNYFINC